MLNSVQHPQDTGVFAGPTRLLVIDDDPVDRQGYLRHLSADEKNSYVVVEAATAEEGIRLLQNGAFDCIILDYRLPGSDGLSVYQAIRNGEGGESIPPVIMMTSQGSEEVAVEAMKCGIADYMTKTGLTAQGFQRAISNAVEKSRLRRTLRERNQSLLQVNCELVKRAAELQRVYHTVSHELKTPLTAVREFIALVLDGVAAPLNSDDNRAFLEHALDGCDQMARQVNDLVDSTRLEMQKLTLKLQAIRPDRVIEFAMASIREVAKAKGLTLKTAIAPDLPPVWADDVRFTQILGNLLGNAAKFTRSGGGITVVARRIPGDSQHLEIAVADTGCGIAPEHLGQVFDRLFQVPRASDDLMGSGLGLGLSIARDLVRLHGGQLTVDSVLGRGSTFRFSLPTAEAMAPIGEFVAA